MPRMTKEEFDRLYLDKAVHCDTEEKANEFLALADSVGYKWNNGFSLIDYDSWGVYRKGTCYGVTKYCLVYSNIYYFNKNNYQIVEYQLQPKFKVGDRVRIKDTIFTTINGKVGVIERLTLSPIPYVVRINGDDSPEFWYCYGNQLEKVEEPTYEEETIDDIIEEIEYHQKAINVLHNRLKRKAKVGK